MKKLYPWIKLYILFAVLVLPFKAFGEFFYQPEAPVEIMTEVTVQDIPGSTTVSRLTVRPANDSGNSSYVTFFNSASQEALGRVVFSSSSRVVWRDAHQKDGKQLQADDLLLVPGIFIPVDVLPVDRFISGGEAEILEFQRKAGGRTFLDRIRISVSTINLDQARQENWIRVEDKLSPVLYIIEATNAETGNLVVKQLWAPKSDWWLYEQTPLRRSWRIPQ